MVYVEWLRVRGALKWTAIVLGVLLLLAVVVRVAVIGVEHNAMSWVVRMQHDPHSTVTDTILPDGTHRIKVDNAQDGVHILIDDHGWRGKHVEILDESSLSHAHESVDSGSIHVRTLPSGRGSLTVIDTNGETKFANFVAVGCIVAMILATVLGAPFARENDGHLEIALTKPVDRTLLALSTVGVDAAGIAAAVALGIVFGIAAQSIFELPFITFGPADAIALGIAILGPLAWYAMLSAATASLKRSYGAILGFAWPVAGLVVLLTFVQPGGNVVFAAIHGVAWVLSTIDPIAYLHMRATPVAIDGQNVLQFSLQHELIMLAVLAVGYNALAIIQWRRVEA